MSFLITVTVTGWSVILMAATVCGGDKERIDYNLFNVFITSKKVMINDELTHCRFQEGVVIL